MQNGLFYLIDMTKLTSVITCVLGYAVKDLEVKKQPILSQKIDAILTLFVKKCLFIFVA